MVACRSVLSVLTRESSPPQWAAAQANLGTALRLMGQRQTGAESWTVLADPEGNEFCVVRPKETLTG